LCMVIVDINLYSMWQARWAKTVSVIRHLKNETPIPNVNIYFLKDDFPLGVDTRGVFDFTFMLIKAWEKQNLVGISTSTMFHTSKEKTEIAQNFIRRWKMKKLPLIYFPVKGFDPQGCLAEIRISPNKYNQEQLIGFRYLFFRIFAPERVKQFLEDLTEVKLQSLNIDAWGRPCL